MSEDILNAIGQCVLKGKLADVTSLVNEALAQHIDALAIIQTGLAKGMSEVGVLFKSGQYFLPEVLVSAKTMGAAVAILEPCLVGHDAAASAGKVVLGTVQGDVHDIGKNIVSMMFRGAGFEVIDLGVNIAGQTFVDAIKEQRPHLVCLSALLSTTMPFQRKTIAAICAAGLREQVKIMVGGAPVTQVWADQIEADAYAPDAVSAVDKARELMGIC